MSASRPISRETAPAPTAPTVTIASADKEALLIEMLLSGLDLRASAAQAGSPMLSYLVDLLVMRAREELQAITVSDTRKERLPLNIPEQA